MSSYAIFIDAIIPVKDDEFVYTLRPQHFRLAKLAAGFKRPPCLRRGVWCRVVLGGQKGSVMLEGGRRGRRNEIPTYDQWCLIWKKSAK